LSGKQVLVTGVAGGMGTKGGSYIAG